MCKVVFAMQELETTDVVHGLCEKYGHDGVTDVTLNTIFSLVHDMYFVPNSGYDPTYDISQYKKGGELPYFFMRIYCSEVLGLNMQKLEDTAFRH